jgi:hypothetical protein
MVDRTDACYLPTTASGLAHSQRQPAHYLQDVSNAPWTLGALRCSALRSHHILPWARVDWRSTPGSRAQGLAAPRSRGQGLRVQGQGLRVSGLEGLKSVTTVLLILTIRVYARQTESDLGFEGLAQDLGFRVRA